MSTAMTPTTIRVYQLKVALRDISPLIWRRLLVTSDTTIAQLHEVLQIAMGWEDLHLHQFRIHGKAYGIYRDGGIRRCQRRPFEVGPSSGHALGCFLSQHRSMDATSCRTRHALIAHGTLLLIKINTTQHVEHGSDDQSGQHRPRSPASLD